MARPILAGLELNRIYLQTPGSRGLPGTANFRTCCRIKLHVECPLSKGFCCKRDSCLLNLAGSRTVTSQRKAAVDSAQAPTVQLSAPPFLCSSIQRRV